MAEAGDEHGATNPAAMTKAARSERTQRVLIARLEELARAAERSGASQAAIARLLESASVATANAIALDLLTNELAESIWTDAARRHPQVEPLKRAA